MKETELTVVGNVVNSPQRSRLSSGASVTNFRMASTSRRFDRETQTWTDHRTLFVDVLVPQPKLLVIGAVDFSAALARARAHVEEVLGATAPHRMTDGRTPAYRDWSGGYDPETWLDRAINATRTEVFPFHGLDPLP